MGNRGVDLAQLKARQAAEGAIRDAKALVEWAQALQKWLSEPLAEGEVVEQSIKVALTGQTLILSKRLAENEPEVEP